MESGTSWRTMGHVGQKELTHSLAAIDYADFSDALDVEVFTAQLNKYVLLL